jgi:isocitrate dehydrogenase kinase/phosphatase
VKGEVYPFILPLLSTGQSIYVDTVIFEPELASIVFGFARAYFMVYAPVPALFVAFLRQIMPRKPDYEIYNAIGCQKHGKTELYRHYQQHLAQSREQFVIAPGIKGMVMSVFTLLLRCGVQGDKRRVHPAQGGEPRAGEGEIPAGKTAR